MRNKFVIVFLGRVLQVVISFVTIKYLTNTLSKEDVARLFLINAVLNYFGISLVSPVGQFMNRYLNVWAEKKALGEAYFNYTLYVLGIALLSIPLIYSLNAYNILDSLVFPNFYIYLAGLIFFSNMNTCFIANFNLLGSPITFVAYTNLWLSVGFVLSYAFINMNGASVEMWLLGLLISHAIFFVTSCFHFCSKFNVSFSFRKWITRVKIERTGGVLRFSLPLLFSTALMWTTTESHRFVIEAQHGLTYLSMFTVGFTVAQKLSYAVESVVSQVFLPSYYEEVSRLDFSGRAKAWLKYFYVSCPFYILILVFSVIFSKQLVLLFSNVEYLDAAKFLVSGAFFNFFRKLTATYAMIAHGEEDTKLLVIPYFVGGVGATLGVYAGKELLGIGPEFMLPLASLLMLITILIRTKHLINQRMSLGGFLNEFRRIFLSR